MADLMAEVMHQCSYLPDSLPFFLERTDEQYTCHYSNSEEFKLAKGKVPGWLWDLLTQLPDGVILAGSSLRAFLFGGEYNDVDLWFTSKEACYATGNELNEMGFRLTRSSEWALTFTKFGYPPVQLIITTWFKDAAHVIDTFDFVNLQFALTKDSFVTTQNREVADSRILALHRAKLPNRTLLRLFKYKERGFHVSDAVASELAMQTIQQAKDHPEVAELVYYSDED